VGDPNDEHDESIVVDLVHDAVVAHPDSVKVVRPGELLDALGAGVEAMLKAAGGAAPRAG
jgi:hypothetical protein